MKRTPGPWGLWKVGDEILITDNKLRRHLALIKKAAPEWEANARYIVTAANHFEEVVQMLKMVTDHANAFECFRDDIGQAVLGQVQDLLARIKKEMEAP